MLNSKLVFTTTNMPEFVIQINGGYVSFNEEEFAISLEAEKCKAHKFLGLKSATNYIEESEEFFKMHYEEIPNIVISNVGNVDVLDKESLYMDNSTADTETYNKDFLTIDNLPLKVGVQVLTILNSKDITLKKYENQIFTVTGISNLSSDDPTVVLYSPKVGKFIDTKSFIKSYIKPYAIKVDKEGYFYE